MSDEKKKKVGPREAQMRALREAQYAEREKRLAGERKAEKAAKPDKAATAAAALKTAEEKAAKKAPKKKAVAA